MKMNRLSHWFLPRPLAATALMVLVVIFAVDRYTFPLAAQENLRIKSMQVSVQPEHDDPRVLVIQQGEIGGGAFPQEVNFYLPKVVEVTEVCGLKKPADEHLCQLYQTRPEGDATVLTYKLPVPNFYFEFYYNPVQGLGERAIDFNFRSFYPVDDLKMDVQQPLRSTGFVLTPASSQVSTDGQGFKYYHYSFSTLSPQTPVGLKIAYQKEDERPSVPKRNAGSTGVEGIDSRTGLIALAVGGAGVLGFFGYLAVRRRPASAPVARQRSNVPMSGGGRGSGPARPKGKGAVAAFCVNCGTPLQEGGSFCASCGSRVRRHF